MVRSGFMVAVVLGSACTGEDSGSDTEVPIEQEPTWEDVRPIVQSHCARCHSANRLSTYKRLETHQDVVQLRSNILDKLSQDPPRGLRMPVASNHVGDQGCTPQHPAINDLRLSDDELSTFVAFLQRTDHQDYVDTTAAIEAPEVPRLQGAAEYVSTEYEVLNDGFITPPDDVTDEYMHEFGYDERDFDQMEDDWFCIRFDPQRADAGFLTGLQMGTENGQIYLNSQLLIDTSGGFDAARQAADERGTDWYKCDAGVGIADTIPLWRTPPGGGPFELPEDTGLRFEPGWTFILRADFHTHFDAEEFNRLDQDGVIDRDAGTMTWFDQAWVRAQWADAVDRELKWMTVGPRTAAERDAFEVPRGESTRTYTASIPEAGEYAVYAAEVGMGKNGTVASLIETGSETCVANNSDFHPKWIGTTVYGEDDSPSLSDDSELALTCTYRNPDDAVQWGAEGEATVWGRRERCSAVVFYYER